jgi:hypothetical protein
VRDKVIAGCRFLFAEEGVRLEFLLSKSTALGTFPFFMTDDGNGEKLLLARFFKFSLGSDSIT